MVKRDHKVNVGVKLYSLFINLNAPVKNHTSGAQKEFFEFEPKNTVPSRVLRKLTITCIGALLR